MNEVELRKKEMKNIINKMIMSKNVKKTRTRRKKKEGGKQGKKKKNEINEEGREKEGNRVRSYAKGYEKKKT